MGADTEVEVVRSEGADGAPRLELRFRGGEAPLAEARRVARQFLEGAAVDEEARYSVELVFEELVGNVFRHSGTRPSIEVALELSPERVTVDVLDDGPTFDPTAHPDPEPPESLDEARIGGLGIAMVRAVVADMRYRREPRHNRLEVDVPRAPEA